MRFTPNGPAIPDKLLFDRDQGRVIFFCGAGISKAFADLPDFATLTKSVAKALGAHSDGPAQKQLVKNETVAFDRVFGLLEQEFYVEDIEAEVAKALKSVGSDLQAHRYLIDLATMPNGNICLITTNFDNLFDQCGQNIPSVLPPKLPNPANHKEMNGIVYLHGKVTDDFNSAQSGGFILSSASFGRAYLSERWATTFIHEVIKHYTVVFVGYGADDPPVTYLLEALASENNTNHLYAFHVDESSDISARWKAKGVQSIVSQNYDGMWLSLKEWAERAKNIGAWNTKIIAMAQQDPALLEPYQRGQVAHLVSSNNGMKLFSEATPAPPADWLCVFDANRRKAEPDLYGLDNDNQSVVMQFNQFDTSKPENIGALHRRGYCETELPERLQYLGIWIYKVSNQPISVWWAAHNQALHPSIQFNISKRIIDKEIDFDPAVSQAWQYLFDFWKDNINHTGYELYIFKNLVEKYGWNNHTTTQYKKIFCPYLKINSADKKIQKNNTKFEVKDLIKIEVCYPSMQISRFFLIEKIDISDNYLAQIIKASRINLELAYDFEIEFCSFLRYVFISPIEKNDKIPDANISHSTNLSVLLLDFVELFSRLVDYNPEQAKNEFNAWTIEENRIFNRLRFWAAGKFFKAQEFAKVLLSLSDRSFWHQEHERDMQLLLKERWHEFNLNERQLIENRLKNGPVLEQGESDAEGRRAHNILNRLVYLKNSNCEFSFDFDAEVTQLKQHASSWEEKYAEQSIAPLSGVCGAVTLNSDHSTLLNCPLNKIVKTVFEEKNNIENILVRNNPFSGLVKNSPARALSAITHTKNKDLVNWAWDIYLSELIQIKPQPRIRLLLATAERLLRLEDEDLSKIILNAARWLLSAYENLHHYNIDLYNKLIDKLIYILVIYPEVGKSSTNCNDWVLEARTSPAGNIVNILFEKLKNNVIEDGNCLPFKLKKQLNILLGLKNPSRCYALVVLNSNLSYFFQKDPDWTLENLISVMNEDSIDSQAAWAGYLINHIFLHFADYSTGYYTGLIEKNEFPTNELFYLIKDALLKQVTNNYDVKSTELLASYILSAWFNIDEDKKERFITNSEMRDLLISANENFRISVLNSVDKFIDADKNPKWIEILPLFFEDVWPKQKSIRTSEISQNLLNIIFEVRKTNYFNQLTEIIFPLLGLIENQNIELPFLAEGVDFIENNPELVLKMLYKVIPTNTLKNNEPYGLKKWLTAIEKASPKLNSDPLMIKLR